MKPPKQKNKAGIAHYLLGMLYFVLSAAPCMILTEWKEDKVVLSRFGYNTSLLYASLGFLPLILIEYLLISFALGLFKGGLRTHSRLVRAGSALSLIALGLTIGGYAAYKAFAWQTFRASGTFMSPDQFLSLVISIDLGDLWLLIADTDDVVTLALGIALCVTVAAGLGYFAPVVTGWRSLIERCLETGAVVLITLVYYAIAVMPSTEAMRSVVKTAMRASISPESSLVAYLLFSGDERKGYPLEQMVLAKRKSLEEWGRGIDRGQARPNFVIVMIEALRSDVLNLAVDGKEIMPNLNRMAREGISFEHAFGNSAETAYSQVVVVTGQHAWRGVSRLLGQEESTGHNIYELMSHAGYDTAQFATVWSSISRLTNSERTHNVDLYRLHLDDYDDDLAPETLELLSHYHKLTFDLYDRINTDLLERWIERRRGPFFALAYYFSTHFPYESDRRISKPLLQTEGADLHKTFLRYPREQAGEYWRRYLNKSRVVDDYLGELRGFLEERGIADDTVLIITGDHGEEFYEHGSVTHGEHLHRVAVQVPLVMWGKPLGRFPRPKESVMDHLQIPPTVLQIAGLPDYEGFQACSALSGRRGKEVFMTSQAVLYEDGVVSWPWKYTKTLNSGEETLFDLSADSEEKTNLASSRGDVLAEMRDKLEVFHDSQLGYHRGATRKDRQIWFPPRYCGYDASE